MRSLLVCIRHTMTGPERWINTCSLYVPGYMKIVCDDESEGSAATAAPSVANSPEVVVPTRTIFAPDGGAVREEGGDKEDVPRGRSTRIGKSRRMIKDQVQVGANELHARPRYLSNATTSVDRRSQHVGGPLPLPFT